MHLHKETLHSPEMATILGKLAEKLEVGEGLAPDEYSPEELYMLYNLAHRLYQVDDYAGAESVFRRLVIARPFEVKHWQGLASVYQMQKNYTEALTAWGMCCLIDRENPLFHYYAAICLHEVGEKDEATEALEKAYTHAKEGTNLYGKISALLEGWATKTPEDS